MGLRLLYADMAKYIADPPRPTLLVNTGITVDGKKLAIKRSEVKEYLNDYFFYYYDIYCKIKTFGLPNGLGWANEPQHIIDAYMVMDRELREIEADKIDGDNKRRGTAGNKA